jgi:hypothetical protein
MSKAWPPEEENSPYSYNSHSASTENFFQAGLVWPDKNNIN